MKIGFIGLGIMGNPMCYNVTKKHDDQVFAYDVNPDRVKAVEAYGTIGCKSARMVAECADVIITVVPRSEHAISVYNEVESVIDETKICIDMSTIDPEVSMDICRSVEAKGAHFLDAPIVKSQEAARMGDVGIYVGGDIDVYKEIKPILQYMGRSIIHMGGHGKGLIMKVCHNALVAQIQNGVNETLALALKQGIDINKYSAAISYGGAQNYYFDSKQQMLRDRDYSTRFSVENMAKDLDICHKMIGEMGVTMPGLEVARNVYEKAMEEQNTQEDFCATLEVVQRHQEDI